MSTFDYDRRSFLRHTGGLGSLAVSGGLTGCLGGSDSRQSTDEALGLQSGMEIGMGFTGFGGLATPSEVDPDEPGGGRLITVEAVEPGEDITLAWRETVEHEIGPSETSNTSDDADTSTSDVEVVERTGTITALGLADAHATFLPMFWDPGDTTTDTSAMWLSTEAFTDLRDTHQTPWSADVLTQITWVGEEVQGRIQDAVDTVEEDDVTLEVEADLTEFELSLSGQTSSVQALAAHDSFGNEYVIIENEANPLVVQFTYNAVSVGLSGFDTALWSLIKAIFSGYRVVSIESP